MDIILEIDNPNNSELQDLQQLGDKHVQLTSPQNFGGGDELLQALTVLSSVSIPVIGKIIIERIRAKKHVTVIADGKKVTGVDADTAIEVLTKLSDNK